ncbi:protein translocase subunit SecD [Candidatus Babeliales bacterium]|nr:protein translocase subunit SecD [Candidatus Babeliales bacterium]MCF7899077.1 protein translocase subunit SecD [Candidatus Babeliales bacterium]
MTGKLAKIFISKFMFFIAILVVGLYFLFSIDLKRPARIEEEKGIKLSFFQKVWESVRMPRLKLGIDLQGGTYLVLGVDIDKAIENKLLAESKYLDQIFKKSSLAVLPSKKDIKNKVLNLHFSDEESAKVCYNLLRKESQNLKFVLKDNIVTAVLPPSEEQRIRVNSVDQAVSILGNRLSGFGVEGISVQQHGDKQVVVQMPGVADPERVKDVITKTARLDFSLVEKTASSKESLLADFDYDLPSDKKILPGRKTKLADEESGEWYLVSAYPDMSGDHIVDARVGFGEFNKVQVNFQLDSSGARDFKELTGNNIGKRLAIIIDDVVYSAPNIQSAIGSTGSISGIASPEEAKDLALVLRSGALSAPITLEQETRVGASLGQDAINKGLLSCIIALILLFIFSIFYYKIPGLLAFLVLVYNLFIILLFLSYFESALNLAGIASMVLTIGMAIDGSILIYEKIKEELAAGSTFRKSVNDGFKDALVVILDSNITTFLTGFILFKFGGPVIRGFAVVLMIGIIAAVAFGVFFLKAIFDFILDNTKIKELKF